MVSLLVSSEPNDPSADKPTARPRAFASPDLGIERARASELRLRSMFDAEFDFVWRSVRRLGLDEGASDDATQETFVIAAKKIDSIEVGRERSFLLGTALRVVSNVRRTRAFRDRKDVAIAQGKLRSDESSQDLTAQTPSEAPLPDEQVEQRRTLERLDRALDSLPEELRDVIVLTELDALPQAEIASVLNLPIGTVASRLRRARRELLLKMANSDANENANESESGEKEMPS